MTNPTERLTFRKRLRSKSDSPFRKRFRWAFLPLPLPFYREVSFRSKTGKILLSTQNRKKGNPRMKSAPVRPSLKVFKSRGIRGRR
jgi:hypothetical protein